MKKTIVITGAAGNLGKTITSNLLKEDYIVEAVLGPKDDLDFISHKNLYSQKINLLDATAAHNFIDDIANSDKHNIISLICLVGGFAIGNLEETESSTIQKMVDLNFKTIYHIARPLIRHCKKKSKPLQLIFVGSRPGIDPNEGKDMVAYSLSKSLIFRLAEYINEDTNKTEIKASVIVPSTMDTPGTRANMPNMDTSLWVPLNQVYQTVSFILSDAGKMMRNPVYKLYNKA